MIYLVKALIVSAFFMFVGPSWSAPTYSQCPGGCCQIIGTDNPEGLITGKHPCDYYLNSTTGASFRFNGTVNTKIGWISAGGLYPCSVDTFGNITCPDGVDGTRGWVPKCNTVDPVLPDSGTCIVYCLDNGVKCGLYMKCAGNLTGVLIGSAACNPTPTTSTTSTTTTTSTSSSTTSSTAVGATTSTSTSTTTTTSTSSTSTTAATTSTSTSTTTSTSTSSTTTTSTSTTVTTTTSTTSTTITGAWNDTFSYAPQTPLTGTAGQWTQTTLDGTASIYLNAIIFSSFNGHNAVAYWNPITPTASSNYACVKVTTTGPISTASGACTGISEVDGDAACCMTSEGGDVRAIDLAHYNATAGIIDQTYSTGNATTGLNDGDYIAIVRSGVSTFQCYWCDMTGTGCDTTGDWTALGTPFTINNIANPGSQGVITDSLGAGSWYITAAGGNNGTTLSSGISCVGE